MGPYTKQIIYTIKGNQVIRTLKVLNPRPFENFWLTKEKVVLEELDDETDFRIETKDHFTTNLHQ